MLPVQCQTTAQLRRRVPVVVVASLMVLCGCVGVVARQSVASIVHPAGVNRQKSSDFRSMRANDAIPGHAVATHAGVGDNAGTGERASGGGTSRRRKRRAAVNPMTGHRVRRESGGVPVGHMQSWGAHRKSEGTIAEFDEMPRARWLAESVDWSNRSNTLPFIVRGAVRAVDRAQEMWDDDFLRAAAGTTIVELEVAKKETRGTSVKWPLERFLDEYRMPQHHDRFYMVDVVPWQIRGDLQLPASYPALMHKQQQPMMWLSTGGTSSVMHADDKDNINCVIEGSKDWIFVAPHFWESVYYGRQWSGYGARSPIDVDAVDLVKFPKVADAPWYHIHQRAGDCIFLQSGWIHQVRSSGAPRSIAVNFWYKGPKANATNDPRIDENGFLSLDSPLWRYHLSDMPVKRGGATTPKPSDSEL